MVRASGAAAASLEEAVTLARRGELQAVVTGPIHKARMYEAGFKFPGQTEFFAERCGMKNFAMCLTGGKITVALVTTHIPFADVSRALNQTEIVIDELSTVEAATVVALQVPQPTLNHWKLNSRFVFRTLTAAALQPRRWPDRR